MSKITADWSLSLDVECPECKEYTDLLDGDDFWDGRPDSFSVFNEKDQDVYCPNCGAEFVCDFQY